ncbi:hypothetical protein SAMN02745166_02198 [Prosthecobacter debontii]|uniref:Uncharacterized protein n=1 Tax=Prosthecobacter debontii TaxID=48467 RepID=A0A1T4XZS7_9BACT|nr:hypothetical protein SAMN02745166_02198 [Prosthecobacter debontii]
MGIFSQFFSAIGFIALDQSLITQQITQLAMSDAQLEQLLGRSLSDDQRSRYYDIERQNQSESNRPMRVRSKSSLPAHQPKVVKSNAASRSDTWRSLAYRTR